MEDELKSVFKQINKGCYAAAYSEGGNFLACANGNNVVVYDAYKFTELTVLTGHSG